MTIGKNIAVAPSFVRFFVFIILYTNLMDFAHLHLPEYYVFVLEMLIVMKPVFTQLSKTGAKQVNLMTTLSFH